MHVRYSYLKQQFSNCNDLWARLKKFVATEDFTLGKELYKFEKNFAKLIGTKYAIGVNSGTDAIKLSLKTLNVGRGDEVITAANTFVATVGAITEIGAKPIFIDCDDTFCMNIDLIEKKITKKTKAIVPVHFTGYQEVQTGTAIIVAEVPYVSGIADSRLTGTLEVNYTAQEDSNRCGYYLFRIHYSGNTTITTVTSSTTNSSMAAAKVNAGDSQAISITPTTTGTQNVLVYYEFKGFVGSG
mgnify:CR=1 FL=1